MAKELESHIQAAILQYLEIKRVFHYRNNSGAYKTDRGGFIRYGTPGSPDIICVIAGKFVGFEVKRPGGKLSELQETFSRRLVAAGGLYFLVTSIDDVINALKTIE